MTLATGSGPDEWPGFITKVLLPRRRTDVLSRPRLVDFINQHLDRKLLLVCAPAGYGKTTLLVDFASQTSVPVCWYTLSPADADPQVFLEYLVRAMQRRFPRFGERTLRYLREAGSKDLEVVAGLFIGELHDISDAPFVTVLDDFHHLDEQPAIQTLMDLLIASLPVNCCWVIASRTIPRLRLSRLVASREAAGLGEADLRFTGYEIQQLFSRHFDLLVPEKMADDIAQEAEGWIAGIILTSHSLWTGLFKGMIQGRGAGGPVFDYLAAEVFDHQAPAVQEFLLGSSILPRLSPELCDRLLQTTASGEMLRALDEANLFLTRLEGEADWYRYHQLFQEFLQARFRRDNLPRYLELHERAGALAEASDTSIALDHYLMAGNVAQAVELIERVADATILAGRSLTLLRWCDRLPDGVHVEKPALQIARARAALDTGDTAAAKAALDVAWQTSSQRGDAALMASCQIWRSAVLRFLGQYHAALDECRAGLAVAQEIANDRLQALGFRQLGTLLSSIGETAEAIPALQNAVARYAALGDRFNQGVVSHHLGVIWRRHGDTQPARVALDRACEHFRAIGNAGMLSGSLVTLGNLAYDQGESERALRLLTEAQHAARESGYLRMDGYATESLGDVQRDGGQLAEARAAYEQGLTIAEKVGDRFLQVASLEGLARCQLYANEPGLAFATIIRARNLANERESIYERALCEDTYGAICLESGRLDTAIAALEPACAWLEKSARGRDLARARLHLALARLRAGERELAIELAQSALQLLPAGPNDPLLVAEGKRLADLLHAAMKVGPPWLHNVLDRLGPTPAQAKSQPAIVLLPSAQATHALQCYTLGRADVELDGRLLDSGDWPTQKAKELWFYLLANGPLPREQVIEALWPDTEPGRGMSALHTTVHRVRKTLFADALERRGDLWGVASGFKLWTEDRAFEEAVLAIRAGAPRSLSPDQLAAADAAIRLYHGPYVLGLDAAWTEPRRRRLESLYLRLVRALVDQAREERRYQDAIVYAELYLQSDPDDEAVNEALMRSHAHLGNRLAALRHYQRYAQQLRDELATQPSRRLRQLSEQIAREG
jgi:ATP/maltotriose-dependent transcriptional regulator MalT/two-component SAPR family response regulator